MNLLSKIASLQTEHFKLIWCSVLLVAIFVGFWLSKRERGVGFWQGVRDELSCPLARRDRPLLGAFLVVFAGYVFLTLFGEDFAGYDDSIFTLFSVRGRGHKPPIWPAEGRYFPLGHQEFNLLRLITRSPTGYHLFAMAELGLLLLAVFFALRELRVPARLGLMSLLLVTPSFLISFTGLIYPERNVLVLLAVFLCAVQAYSRRGSPFFFICALVAAQGALYFKEPVFLLISAFAAARLAIGWLEERCNETKARIRRVVETHSLDLAVLALVLVFVVLLALALLPRGGSGYVDKVRNTSRGPLALLAAYLRVDSLLGLYVAVFSARMLLLVRARRLPDPIWDALALGGLAYAAAVFATRLFSPYYMAPTDLVAVLYLGWLAARSSRSGWVAALVCFIAVQDIAYSSFRVIERKNTLRSKIELAEFLEADLQTPGVAQLRLFFPYTRASRLMEFAGYLSYKGFAIQSDESRDPPERASLVLAGPGEFPGGHCVDYRPFWCLHESAPQPGDLVVLFPDDVVPPGVRQSLEQRDRLVYGRTPVAAPRAARSLFSVLRTVSDSFADVPLPEDWLELRVFSEK